MSRTQMRVVVAGWILGLAAGIAPGIGWGEESAAKPPHAPQLLWKHTCGPAGLSAPPAIHGGVAVVGSGWSGSELHAVRLTDGGLEWRRALDDNGVGAVVRDGDTTYSTTESCTIYSIPTKSGKIAWKRWLGDPVLSTPALEGDRVYVGSGAARDSHFHLMCLDKRTGRDVWTRRIPCEITGSPAVQDGRVYVSLNDGSVRAFDRNGRELWKRNAAAASVPTLDGKNLLVNTRGGTILACLETDTGKPRWETSVSSEAGNVLETGATLWTMASTPIRTGHSIFVGTRTGELVCLNAHDGATRWSTKLQSTPPPADPSDRAARRAALGSGSTSALSSPAFANGKVYVGSLAGGLFCVDARTGDVIWRFEAGGAIRWSPVLHKGRVYVTTDQGLLLCMDAGDPKADGWDQWGGNAAHTMTNTRSPGGGRGVVGTPDDEETVTPGTDGIRGD